MTKVRPAGLDRIKVTADQYGWTRRGVAQVGYTHRKTWDRGDKRVTVDHSVRGAITWASRNWGPEDDRYGKSPGMADQVIGWLMEAADVPEVRDAVEDSRTPARGRIYEAARNSGWCVNGGSLEVNYRARTTDLVEIGYEPDGSLKWARRNFGATGRPRAARGKESATLVLGWFAEGAQTAAKPVVRPAQPNTPDRKIRRALEDLADTAGALQRTWERGGDFSEADLAVLGQSLKALRESVTDAEVEAHSLRRQRRYESAR